MQDKMNDVQIQLLFIIYLCFLNGGEYGLYNGHRTVKYVITQENYQNFPYRPPEAYI